MCFFWYCCWVEWIPKSCQHSTKNGKGTNRACAGSTRLTGFSVLPASKSFFRFLFWEEKHLEKSASAFPPPTLGFGVMGIQQTFVSSHCLQQRWWGSCFPLGLNFSFKRCINRFYLRSFSLLYKDVDCAFLQSSVSTACRQHGYTVSTSRSCISELLYALMARISQSCNSPDSTAETLSQVWVKLPE